MKPTSLACGAGSALGGLGSAPSVGPRDDLRNFPRSVKRLREERRKLLTRGERIFGWAFSVLPPPLVFVAVLLMVNGVSKAIGIPLIIFGLLMAVIPVSPVLGARVRRREAAEND
jgi:hypothetical protein